MPSVLFVSPSAYPLGGVAVWLDYLVPGLQARGWVVGVGLASGRWHDASAYRRAHPLPCYIDVPVGTGTKAGRSRSLARAIGHGRWDVVASVNSPDVFAAAALARGMDGHPPRAVMTLHSLQSQYFDDIAAESSSIDAVICTNRLTCKLALARGAMDAFRILYAGYGVPIGDDPPSRPSGEARRIRIVYCGRVEMPQKRVLDLPPILDATLAAGVDAHLSIAGDGPAMASLRRALAHRESQGRVSFLGAVPAAETLERVYRSADILLLTSCWETGPIVAWEAMAAGLPVVSSEFVGMTCEAAIRDGENALLFPVGDAAAAAAAIAKAADDGVRARLSSAGLALVKARYSVDASVVAWDAALRRVLELPRLPVAGRVRPAPSGRLDRVLGPRIGEAIRSMLGRVSVPSGPGDEWPHSYGRIAPQGSPYWDEIAALDRSCGRHP